MSKRSTIISFALLVLLLTAGAAQGLDGSNTVFSDDIVDGTIGSADVSPTIKFGCQSSGGPSFATVDSAAVPLNGAYATTGVTAKRNCSGLEVKAKRIGTGVVCVKFGGNPRTNGVVTPIGGAFQAGINDRIGSGACNGSALAKPGEFEVILRTNDSTPFDLPFTILAF